MKGKMIFVLWLLTAVLLYFFENNTGTRIILIASVCLPLTALLLSRSRVPPEDIRPAVSREDEPVDIRPYVPGDPVKQIHWKLSAKTDRLLVRIFAPAPAEAERSGPVATVRPVRRFWPLAPIGLLLLCLFLPPVRLSLQSLCNQLFDWSEALNPYVYQHFPVPSDANHFPAVCLLGCLAFFWILLLVFTRSSWLCLLTACGLAGFQIYFGVSLPWYANVSLFALPGLFLLRRNRLLASALLLLLSLLICLLFPGVDPLTENASEQVRDWLSQAARQTTEQEMDESDGILETRHVNDRSLRTGNREAQAERSFRLITLEEQQISRPPWMDWVKTFLLLLASLALIVLPFVPLVLVDQLHRRDRERQKAFLEQDLQQALPELFRYTVFWLELGGYAERIGAFRDGATALGVLFSADYATLYARSVEVFERTVYSGHAPTEADRLTLLELLNQTRHLVRTHANLRTRLILWMVFANDKETTDSAADSPASLPERLPHPNPADSLPPSGKPGNV